MPKIPSICEKVRGPYDHALHRHNGMRFCVRRRLLYREVSRNISQLAASAAVSVEMFSMCGKFTQMASWRDVHAFSQPLVETDSEVVSTPMRFANIIRLNEAGNGSSRRTTESRLLLL